jgi:hypothetical protein
LDTDDRVVTAADSDALAAMTAILVIVSRVAADVGALTCTHSAQL